MNQSASVVQGSLVYDVTPSMILTEWHRLYSTWIKYNSLLQAFVAELELEDVSEWTLYNITTNWSEILLTRSESTGRFTNIC